ncbi:MAG TPA: methionine aminotransferase [Chitinophagaceae bacterium]|jgi:Aspartate/tyrosine/aromatic aminotransferase
MPAIQSKLPAVGTTIFTIMSALASKHGAVNLGQGFPDYSMNSELIDLVKEAMKTGHNQYVHMAGYAPLRKAIAEKIKSSYQTNIDPETEVTITPGGTYAVYTALTTVLQPGDEVIVFEPAYDSYLPNIEINGAVPVLINLQFPEYKINWDLVRQKITTKTKVIMLNSPHNPTGAVLSKNDLSELRSVIADTNIFIVSDEVYEHLIFDEIEHESILRYPDLLQRSFVCFSFGKNYHCTGWKLGYCIAPGKLMNEFKKVHQFNAFSCHTPTQVALAKYLQNKEAYNSLGKMMQAKRDFFQRLMERTKFTPLPSHGSYFQLYKYENISDEADTEFAKRLTIENKVATIPVSAFYRSGKDDKVLRFCFAKKNETLQQAVENLIHL